MVSMLYCVALMYSYLNHLADHYVVCSEALHIINSHAHINESDFPIVCENASFHNTFHLGPEVKFTYPQMGSLQDTLLILFVPVQSFACKSKKCFLSCYSSVNELQTNKVFIQKSFLPCLWEN